MHFQNNDYHSKFILPSGMTTSGSELKHLQHKLLRNHYEKHTELNKYPYNQSKSLSQYSQSNNKKSTYSERVIHQKDNYLQVYDTQHQSVKDRQRNGLANDLLEQINQKNMKKQFQRKQTLQQENNMIKHLTRLDTLQKQKQRTFNEKYQKEAKEDLQMKQKKNENQKRSIKKTFENSSINRSQSLHDLANNASPHYLDPTKSYVNQVGQAMKVRDSIVSNPEYMTSAFKITNTNQKLKVRDSLDMNYLQHHYGKQQSLLQTIRNKEMREKLDLKSVLINQIREKQQSRKLQKQMHLIPYATNEFKTIHHPINNPVDFRYAHDNRYVIGELKSLH